MKPSTSGPQGECVAAPANYSAVDVIEEDDSPLAVVAVRFDYRGDFRFCDWVLGVSQSTCARANLRDYLGAHSNRHLPWLAFGVSIVILIALTALWTIPKPEEQLPTGPEERQRACSRAAAMRCL
jgi:hypothetical protein